MTIRTSGQKYRGINLGVRRIRVILLSGYAGLFALTVGSLAIGGGRDPSFASRTVSLLGGTWRFHPGDIRRDQTGQGGDNPWEVIELTPASDSHDADVGIPGVISGWRARGHEPLDGYAWYTRVVFPPQAERLVLVGPPMVDDGYELYWNGRLLGGIGRLGGVPKVGQVRPAIYNLPDSTPMRPAQLAIRTFMQPGIGRDTESGGLRTLPVLATADAGAALYRAQWRRAIAGYIVDAVEPIAMIVLAVFLVATGERTPRSGFARWTALALLATACLRGANALIAWTDAIDLPGYDLMGTLLTPGALVLWTLAGAHWSPRRVPKLFSALVPLAGLLTAVGSGLSQPMVAQAGRLVAALLFASVVLRTLLTGERGVSASFTMLMLAVALFADELTALGLKHIWFPFGIGVSRSQVAYALAIPLIAFAANLSTKGNREDVKESVRSSPLERTRFQG